MQWNLFDVNIFFLIVRMFSGHMYTATIILIEANWNNWVIKLEP